MLALSSLLIATPVLQPVAIDWEARASALEAQVNQLKTQLNASHSSTGLSVSVQVAPLDGPSVFEFSVSGGRLRREGAGRQG